MDVVIDDGDCTLIHHSSLFSPSPFPSHLLVFDVKDQNLLQRGKLSLGVKVVRSLFHGKVYTFMKQVYDQAFNEDQVSQVIAVLKDLLWPRGTFVETGGDDPTSAEMDADLKKVRERLGKGGREGGREGGVCVWCVCV
jgi:hypothetical protein